MTNVLWLKRNSASVPTSGVMLRSSVHQQAISSGCVNALQTRCGVASMVNSLIMAAIVVPFCFHVARQQNLTYRLSIKEKGNAVKGVPRSQPFDGFLDLALRSESTNSASQVEIGGGENRGQRIEQGGPATFSQRTSLWSAQPFMGQHDFRHRTLVEKVQRDDGSPALRCSAGPGKDQFFGWNNLQVGANHGIAVL